MVIDEHEKQTNGKEFIEVLVSNGHISTWITALATKLYIVDKAGNIRPVNAIRVRKD